MSSYNKAILMGNLTRDPELKHTNNGTAVCSFGLAVNDKYKTAAGEDREEVYFADITVWGKQGENCAKYLKKGASALVEGKLCMDTWDDKDTGAKRSKTSITANNVKFTSAKSEESGAQTPPPMNNEPQGPVPF